MIGPTSQTLTLVRTFRQDEFDAFARLSGDDNPIHVDPAFAANSAFGRPVAHGMLLYSVLRGLASQLLPGGKQASQDLKFPAPAFADEPIRFEVTVSGSEGDQHRLHMRAARKHDGEVVCEGEALISTPQKDKA